MTKKSLELLKQASTESKDYSENDIELLMDAVSSEVAKIRDKAGELYTDDEKIHDKLRRIRLKDSMALDRSLFLSKVASIVTLFALSIPVALLIEPLIILVPIIGMVFTPMSLIALLYAYNDNEIKRKYLTNPSWFYKLRLKMTPKATAKYQLFKNEYESILLKNEEYARFRDKKMELISPALEVINDNLEELVLSVDGLGKLSTKNTTRSIVKKEMQELVSTRVKSNQLESITG